MKRRKPTTRDANTKGLTHLSMNQAFAVAIEVEMQRRGRDSNPRMGLSPLQHFQCCSFGHSDTSPVCFPGSRYGILAAAVFVFDLAAPPERLAGTRACLQHID